eukprot:831473-Prorocentrum_minimum.AAC.1
MEFAAEGEAEGEAEGGGEVEFGLEGREPADPQDMLTFLALVGFLQELGRVPPVAHQSFSACGSSPTTEATPGQGYGSTRTFDGQGR